jgi:DNA-binding NarL/FixJ family response regulator
MRTVPTVSHRTHLVGDAMITAAVVDDEVLVRGGIRSVLERDGDVTVVGESGDGAGAIELVRRHRPRVVLMDVHMPGMDGLTAAEHLRRLAPETAIVLVATTATGAQIQRAVRAGVSGFMLKNGNPRELADAVRAAARGEAMLSPVVTRLILDRVAAVDVDALDRARSLVATLTDREREVLDRLSRGLGNLQIARLLYLSEGAIKAHVSNLLRKLSCENRVQAAILAHDARLATVA